MKNLNIVVAEDDHNDVILIGRAFSEADVQANIHYLSDGQELIEWFQREYRPDQRVLLLLDLRMPCVDGFEFLRWLKDQPFRSRVLVVVLSSSESNEDMNRACSLGACFYVVKPRDPRELVHVVQRLQNFYAESLGREQETDPATPAQGRA